MSEKAPTFWSTFRDSAKKLYERWYYGDEQKKNKGFAQRRKEDLDRAHMEERESDRETLLLIKAKEREKVKKNKNKFGLSSEQKEYLSNKINEYSICLNAQELKDKYNSFKQEKPYEEILNAFAASLIASQKFANQEGFYDFLVELYKNANQKALELSQKNETTIKEGLEKIVNEYLDNNHSPREQNLSNRLEYKIKKIINKFSGAEIIKKEIRDKKIKEKQEEYKAQQTQIPYQFIQQVYFPLIEKAKDTSIKAELRKHGINPELADTLINLLKLANPKDKK